MKLIYTPTPPADVFFRPKSDLPIIFYHDQPGYRSLAPVNSLSTAPITVTLKKDTLYRIVYRKNDYYVWDSREVSVVTLSERKKIELLDAEKVSIEKFVEAVRYVVEENLDFRVSVGRETIPCFFKKGEIVHIIAHMIGYKYLFEKNGYVLDNEFVERLIGERKIILVQTE